jgi:SecD-like export protein
MKTLAEILRDADPVASEPRRSAHERRIRRQAILDASRVADDIPRRRTARATIVALAIAAIAVTSFGWWRIAIEAVAAVRFEARLAEETPTLELREVLIAGTNRKIYLHAEPVVANRDIAQARVVPGSSASTFGVAITFTPEGAAKMRRATENHVGRPLAILLDGEVASAPVLRSPISTSAIISGDYTRAEAERIVGGILGR